jgi:hypothetical protein
MSASHDDLLQPTLSADLDVRNYRRLFRPQSILWPAFFGGPVAGGILFGLNYARMGRRDLASRCWVGGVAVALVLAFVIGWYITEPALREAAVDRTRKPDTSLTRIAFAGISVAIGWFIAKHQNPRFDAWEGGRNEPAKLLFPGLLAVLTGALFVMGALLVTVAMRRGFA